MAAIGPYLAQSQGEADVHRSELIALVHARMPSSLFE